MKKPLIIIVVLLLVATAAFWYWRRKQQKQKPVEMGSASTALGTGTDVVPGAVDSPVRQTMSQRNLWP